MLTAVSLILFIIELRIPNLLPIPGMKLGLANIVTVYSVYSFRTSETAMMVMVRLLLGTAFSANPSAFIYSACGAFACLAGMIILKKIIPVGYIWLSSIVGAVLHNTGQIIAAFAITRSPAVFAYYPPLVAAGCIAGLFTGICALMIIKRTDMRDKKIWTNGRDDK